VREEGRRRWKEKGEKQRKQKEDVVEKRVGGKEPGSGWRLTEKKWRLKDRDAEVEGEREDLKSLNEKGGGGRAKEEVPKGGVE
jgi:hypothetical protein